MCKIPQKVYILKNISKFVRKGIRKKESNLLVYEKELQKLKIHWRKNI